MWEKAVGPDRESNQLYPPQTSPRAAAKTVRSDAGEGALLFVQLLLCAVILAFALLSRGINAPYLGALRSQCERLLSQGASLAQQDGMARFASGSIQQLRMTAQELLGQLDAADKSKGDAALTGAGGSWPVKSTKKAPAGTSLKDYALTQTLLLPVRGPLTSGYGFREHPITGADDFHAGIDIGAAQDTPVACALDGQVVRTGWNAERGNYIVVRHADGIQTLYQHLAYVFLRAGEPVRRGEILGAVGSTGVATGPHLHFELILNGIRVDPAKSLPELFQ